MTQEDLYADFADRYDLPPLDPSNLINPLVDFVVALLREHSARDVLDCACGTGADLITLCAAGLNAVGSDASPSMLREARKNLANAGISSTLVNTDYRELPNRFEQRFDAVLCLRSSLAHMPNDEEALRALTSMRSVLRPEGLLVLSQATTERQWQDKPRFILQARTAQLSRVVAIDYVGERDAVYHIVDVGQGEPALQIWSTPYHFLFRADQERLLRHAGFKKVTFYGGHSGQPYDEDSSRNLITVARQ